MLSPKQLLFYSGFNVFNEYIWSEIQSAQAVIYDHTRKISNITDYIKSNLISKIEKLRIWWIGKFILSSVWKMNCLLRSNDWPADPMQCHGNKSPTRDTMILSWAPRLHKSRRAIDEDFIMGDEHQQNLWTMVCISKLCHPPLVQMMASCLFGAKLCLNQWNCIMKITMMNIIKWKFYHIGENSIHGNAFEKLSENLWLLCFGLMRLQVNLQTWQMRQHHPTCKDKRRWICVSRQNLET